MGQQAAINPGDGLQTAVFNCRIGDGNPGRDHLGFVSGFQPHAAILMPVCAGDMGAGLILGQSGGRGFDAHMLDRVQRDPARLLRGIVPFAPRLPGVGPFPGYLFYVI